MITCMIVDDEQHAVNQITRHVQKTTGLQLVHTNTNAAEALQWLLRQQPQLVFLDVEMPELSGFDFIKAASTTPARFILCTGFTKYAMDAFDHHVIDYLLKPVTYARFLNAVQKAGQLISPPAPAPPAGDYIFIKAGAKHRQVKVNFKDIEYAEALNGYTCLYMAGQKILSSLSMKELLELLPRPWFIRVHNSYIIPVSNIACIDAGEIILAAPKKAIPVGPAYKSQVQQMLTAGRCLHL